MLFVHGRELPIHPTRRMTEGCPLSSTLFLLYYGIQLRQTLASHPGANLNVFSECLFFLVDFFSGAIKSRHRCPRGPAVGPLFLMSCAPIYEHTIIQDNPSPHSLTTGSAALSLTAQGLTAAHCQLSAAGLGQQTSSTVRQHTPRKTRPARTVCHWGYQILIQKSYSGFNHCTP